MRKAIEGLKLQIPSMFSAPSAGLTEGVGLKRAATGEVDNSLQDAQLFETVSTDEVHAANTDVLDSASHPLWMRQMIALTS